MPFTGPVAYQRHSDFFTDEVISCGVAQVTPSSALCVTKTRRVSLLVPLLISRSPSAPRFHVIKSHTTPVISSTTGAGLPHTLSPSERTICWALQVLPLSDDRLRSRSILPVSLPLFLRPSQKARRVPLVVTTM